MGHLRASNSDMPQRAVHAQRFCSAAVLNRLLRPKTEVLTFHGDGSGAIHDGALRYEVITNSCTDSEGGAFCFLPLAWSQPSSFAFNVLSQGRAMQWWYSTQLCTNLRVTASTAYGTSS